MTEKSKPQLKVVKKRTDLTPKQRAFVEGIVKGKLGSHIEVYMSVYDVARTKTGGIPKHAYVDCSKLMSHPKISLSISNGLQRKEDSLVASAHRTRSYVIEQLYKESKESDSDASRVRALELLGKSVSLFSDVVETKESRSSDLIESEIESRLVELLKDKE
tara:strand:+ start:3198 stop:3680 length:483 start_codon:yes stop_codon:yes gene_type:complete